jgi:hypothetical protein
MMSRSTINFLRASYALPLLCVAALAAAGQDLPVVAPQADKIEYEDARVRVERLKIAENETLPMHDRPARIVIPLTPGEAKLTRPDGTSSISKTDAGHVAWSGPTKRSVTNVGPPLENIVVDLKGITEPAHPLAHPPDPPPAGYLSERFHRWLFENQYVRAYEVRVPPGETTDFHLHSIDNLVVVMSDATVQTQEKDQPWGKPRKVAGGSLTMNHDAQQPHTHRLKNDGTTDYHAVVIQFLQ